MSEEREPGRYEGVPEVTGYYRVPDVQVADLESLVGRRELQDSLANLEGVDLLRAFEYCLRTGAGEASQPLISIRRELQLRVGLLDPFYFNRLRWSAEAHGEVQGGTVREGAEQAVLYGEPRCRVCDVNLVDWPDHVTEGGCPKCGGPLHAADGAAACGGYYDDPKRCDYHVSADDGLREYEGADSPAGVRYHDPEQHGQERDFD
jgi:hypothetical protein